jgi:hypothetical protein
MYRNRLVSQLLLFAALCPFAGAQGTKLWNQSRFDEFEKGRPHGVAIRSDGSIIPGPKVSTVASTPSTYVWAVAADSAGNAYLATGSPATVLKVSPDGKSTKIFETKDLTVQAIAIGPDGSVYAATLPSGKVYKLKADGPAVYDTSAAVAFDPASTDEKPKYIWDLLFDAKGRLYIAAGGPAAIYRVDVAQAGSKPELFFKSDEQHIRCMAFDHHGNLIAGSDGTGLVYRIGEADGKGFVIYDAPKREVTAVAVADDGSIWASAVGERNRTTLPPLPVTGNVVATATITIVQPGSVQAFNANSIVAEGSDIYEISPSGAPRKLWSDKETVVYALHPTPQGLLVATGNRGRIFRIHENGEYEDLAHLEASQAVGFADSQQGYLVATANSGKLYSLTHAADPEANYESDVFDAGVFSTWGRAETHASSNDFDLFARSGNVESPERNWSEWAKVTPNSATIGVPSARFVQWKAVLRKSVSLASVGLNYLPVNVAPAVDEIVVQPGARVNSQNQAQPMQQTINISFPSAQNNSISFSEGGNQPLPASRDKSAVTARWSAHDDNGDDLVYSVYFRADSDSEWRLLKDGVTEKYYSFDSALLPDGGYRIKVIASDAPSHNPGDALTSDRVSDRFMIDTAPPTITALAAQLAGEKIHVTATATDSASPISHAEYSVDAGPWQYIEPVGKLSDSLEERYDFSAPVKAGTNAAAGEHLVTLRVYDRFENVTAAKTLVR